MRFQNAALSLLLFVVFGAGAKLLRGIDRLRGRKPGARS